jgi:hypothetical protein
MDLSDCAFRAGAVAPALMIRWFRTLHALLAVSVVLGYCFIDIVFREISIELYRVRASFAFGRVLRGAGG